MMDTYAGTQGAVPHCTQVSWHFDGSTARGSRKIIVDGTAYSVGRGDPGRAADGEYNNCLIDSLRQCVGMVSDRKAVRKDLMDEFRNAELRAKVTLESYLDIESHWRSILTALFRHNGSNLPTECDLRQYCVIALYANRAGHGVVFGSLNAPCRLVVLNDSDIHFDPCLQL